MSFSEFMQWVRNFFSARSAPNSSSGGSVNTTPVKPAPPSEPASPSVSDTSTDNVDSTPAAPVNAEPQTPPPLPETPPPAINTPSTPPVEPPIQLPIIANITSANSKVALNQGIVFQIVTNPANQYDGCQLDLSRANDASVVQAIDPITGQFSLKFDKASSSDNDTQLIRVNNPQGDTSIAVTVSLMKLFWHNHPGRKNVCDETLFVNQCAIRMGTALELSGIKMTQDRRILRRCTTEYRAFKHHKDGVVKGHVLAAQELANWIKSQRSTFGSRSIVNSQEEILGRSGIIFFRDGWGTTDHIDVWDGQALVGGFPSYFDSDFKELWFWDVY